VCPLSKFADDTKLGGAVNCFRGKEALQKDLARLKHRAITDYLKFNKNTCQILHLGWCNPGYMYRFRGKRLDCSPGERDVEILDDSKLNMSQQCALAAKKADSVLGCTKHSIANWSKGMIVLLHSTLMQPHLKSCVQYWTTKYTKDMKVLEYPKEDNKDGERTIERDL